jgi:hypothetical protein
MAITNGYFDGITTHDGSIIIAHPGRTALRTVRPLPAAPQARAREAGRRQSPEWRPPVGAVQVRSPTARPIWRRSTFKTSRRSATLVDEDAGVVLAIAIFIRKPGTPTRRNVLSEWFVIDSSRIRTIYSAMFNPPPEAPAPNWPL